MDEQSIEFPETYEPEAQMVEVMLPTGKSLVMFEGAMRQAAAALTQHCAFLIASGLRDDASLAEETRAAIVGLIDAAATAGDREIEGFKEYLKALAERQNYQASFAPQEDTFERRE
jgi:hypothetical protein